MEENLKQFLHSSSSTSRMSMDTQQSTMNDATLNAANASTASLTAINLSEYLNGVNGNGYLSNGANLKSNLNLSNGVNSSSNLNGNNQFGSCKTEWVRLNIGGQYFVTTKTTLCKNHQSFFYKLLQDDPSIGLTTDKVIFQNLI